VTSVGASIGLTVPPEADGWLRDPVESGAAAGFGVYLHVPFCHHRCGYCDFATEPVAGLDDPARDGLMQRYSAALVADIAAQARARDLPTVTSVFVGGGTPTLLPPPLLARILASVRAELDVAQDVEVTVECNPETAHPELFSALAVAGVTRVSMGAQSFDARVLATLDRLHRPERTAEAVAQVLDAGIAHVSVDLIYGTPGEDAASWEAGLDAVLAMPVDHVSAYALSVHANTPLGRAVAAGRVPPPDDDVQRERFEAVRATLGDAGFEHYEVSNFATSGAARSRHNTLYWRHGDYLGVGVGAHAHQQGRRWWTTRSTMRYLEESERPDGERDALGRLVGVTTEEVLDVESQALERVMLGLRLREGLHARDVPPIAPGALEETVQAGLLRASGERLQSTGEGWFLLDEAVRRLVSP
jgi:putative oxygen-independent coproporphyrinogen III oxidase